MGNFYGHVLCQLFLVLSAHVAAVLSGSRTPLLNGQDGWHRGAGVCRDSRRHYGNRMAGGSSDRPRGDAHEGPEDLHSGGAGVRDHHSGRRRDAKSDDLDGPAHARLCLLWGIHVESLGNYSNDRRPGGRGQMDRPSKLCWQLGGGGCTLDHGIRCRPHRPVLLGLCCLGSGRAGGGDDIRVLPGTGRTDGLGPVQARSECLTRSVTSPMTERRRTTIPYLASSIIIPLAFFLLVKGGATYFTMVNSAR